MELREEVLNDLKYAQEHLACECYMSKEDSVWGNIAAEPGEYVIREPLKRNALVFIMSGTMEVSTAGTVCRKVGGGQYVSSICRRSLTRKGHREGKPDVLCFQ